ncbi:MAG: molybdopterin-dependent oxidoreductase [Chloroflexota bacterium]|nr:molybdopterin-dependent oxidoreductase [Chloroflexota bacterium]
MMTDKVSRRTFLKSGGALVVSFSLAACSNGGSAPTPTEQRASSAASPTNSPASPATAVATERAEQAPTAGATAAPLSSPIASSPVAGSSAAETMAPNTADQVDSWLAIANDGNVTVFSGKVELGTGVQTALAQIVADELDIPFARITMVMGDTARTPDEGYTAGSATIQSSGVVLRQASAEARQALLSLAADRLGVPAAQLAVKDGVVSVQSDPTKNVTYASLIGNQRFNRKVSGKAPLKNPDQYTVVGTPVPRVDIVPKITGGAAYVQDFSVPGMLHGRVVRPAGVGATLQNLDEGSVANLPGIVKVVRNGNFVGIVTEREEQAINAARQLKVTWQTATNLPKMEDLSSFLRNQTPTDKSLKNDGDVDGAIKSAAKTLQATYQQPYQMHASIGPSCAIADVQPGKVVIWSSTQGVYPLRGALAQLLGTPADAVQVIHMEGSGCYGHNGFDDAAADAALLSKAVGKPVRVQWMRQDEHAWEPKGPAMVMEVKGGLDPQGTVVAWDYGVWTPTHSTRPGGMSGNLLAGQLIAPPAPAAKNGTTGGDRNAPTNYTFKNNRVVAHWLANSPLRPSALRSLGGVANTFANESFMDELAAAAASDPVQFRLHHLDDPRAIAVVQKVADLSGWQSRSSPGPDASGAGTANGRGVSFIRYENTLAYCAVVAAVAVDRGSGQVQVQHVSVAHDCGLIINPDGLKNQIEGNVIQATSRALKEQVTFDQSRVTSIDWRSYPILTFPEVPTVDIALLNQPHQPALGVGEIASLPVAAAIANAIFDATGRRIRSIPFTPATVKAALV